MQLALVIVYGLHYRKIGQCWSPTSAASEQAAINVTLRVHGKFRLILLVKTLGMVAYNFRPYPGDRGEGSLQKYSKQTSKSMLPAFSCHSGIVNQALVNSCISYAQRRSCYHLLGNTVKRQGTRFEFSDYSDGLMSSVLEKCFSKEEQKLFGSERMRGRSHS